MKLKLLTSLFLLTFSSQNSWAASASSEAYIEKLKEQNPALAKSLELDGVKTVYDTCFQSKNQNGVINNSELMTCVWDGVKDNESLKKEITQIMSDNKSARATASEASDKTKIEETNIGNRYEDKSINNKEEKKSKSLLALEETLRKQLREALYGKSDPTKNTTIKTERIVSDDVFFELYESQLGKNVIAAISNFCLESYSTEGYNFYIENKRVDIRKSNLTKLQDQLKDYQATWNSCIGNIKNHCYMPSSILIQESSSSQELKEVVIDFNNEFQKTCEQNITNGSIEIFKDVKESCDDIKQMTKTKACEAVDYVEKARISLDATIKIKEKMKELNNSNGEKVAEVYSSKNNKKIDEITTLTSNTLAMNADGKSSALEAAKEESEEFKKCFDQGQIVDKEACAQYLDTNSNERSAELVEMKINAEASIAEIEELVKDKENVKKLLMQDGYSEEIATTLADNEKIKEEIKNRYKEKELAILKSAQREIESLTTTKDGEVSDLDNNKLKKIEDNLKNKTMEFAQLVYFNNIVSGFLNVSTEDENGNKVDSQNTISAKRELDNSIFTDANREIASKSQDTFKDQTISDERVKTKFAESGISLDATVQNGDTTNLSPTTIVEQLIGIFKPASDKK